MPERAEYDAERVVLEAQATIYREKFVKGVAIIAGSIAVAKSVEFDVLDAVAMAGGITGFLKSGVNYMRLAHTNFVIDIHRSVAPDDGGEAI